MLKEIQNVIKSPVCKSCMTTSFFALVLWNDKNTCAERQDWQSINNVPFNAHLRHKYL
jgi:hypothetical protein